MTYATLIEPGYGEDPKHYQNRMLEIDRIFAIAAGPAQAARVERASEAGLMSLFGMEVDPRA